MIKHPFKNILLDEWAFSVKMISKTRSTVKETQKWKLTKKRKEK